MKKTISLLITLIIFLFTLRSAIAQSPSYTLTVKNLDLVSINDIDDAVEFSIYLQSAPAPAAAFLYAAGQFDFTFNHQIAPIGELEYSILPSPPGPSVLPTNLMPQGPQILTRVEDGVTVYILALSNNSFPGCGNQNPFFISSDFPGTLIAKMRLRRTTGTFNVQPLNLQWRHQGSTNVAITKVFAYLTDPPPCANANITNPSAHTIDPYITPLPVELSSFTSSVNRNYVNLNWTTVKEINNSGFDIERKAFGSKDWVISGNISGSGTTEESKNYSFTERLNTGKYNYRLKQIDYNGNFEYFNLSIDVEVGIPTDYNITQNYPNPFNPTTKIDYDIPKEGSVKIVLYDISGREMATLVNDVKTAGYYTLQFNASNIASGMYFYRISSGSFVSTKRMMVIK